ncbi:hypothetical protein G7072_11160 [Nocardioides sp. HDW12B]|uniref:DUF6326 family protein n=1 Tax=Nocardioides sp. HDW12B TaxID=2714939 RepID=UPI00140BA936|nr:DUF6326 family protein [Nocardioides sp. HDW12B]QIK66823.1 hypothetical protein G7072_11160 [Nocardioides sp. HDW12B]
MNPRPTTATLDDPPLPTRVKLAAAWTSFTLLYAYVDILNFYTPGTVEEILDGRVFEFALSQTFSVSALALVSVPILMVVLSVALPAKAARATTLGVAALYVPVTVFNLAGGTYLYYYGLGVTLELFVLALIVRWAWTWPRAVPTVTADGGAVRARQRV